MDCKIYNIYTLGAELNIKSTSMACNTLIWLYEKYTTKETYGIVNTISMSSRSNPGSHYRRFED